MHTQEIAGVVFNYNGDLSGDVRIRAVDGRDVLVPGIALLRFVSDWKYDQNATEEAAAEEDKPEIAIVCIKGKWFVRRICASFHDIGKDHKIYICDQPLGGPFSELKYVPAVEAIVDEAVKEGIFEQREFDDMP